MHLQGGRIDRRVFVFHQSASQGPGKVVHGSVLMAPCRETKPSLLQLIASYGEKDDRRSPRRLLMLVCTTRSSPSSLTTWRCICSHTERTSAERLTYYFVPNSPPPSASFRSSNGRINLPRCLSAEFETSPVLDPVT